MILVTGGSRGIGEAISDFFPDVVTVARSNADEVGDIRDKEFRAELVQKYTPRVFINNAGISGFDNEFEDVMDTNYFAALDLLHKFHEKMPKGNIINIGSMSAELDGFTRGFDRMSYALSKKNLEDASAMFNQMKSKPVKVTHLALGMVDTSINNGVKKRQPLSVDNVVETIQWILSQPKHIDIGMIKLDNAGIFSEK